ncbi:glycosyl hydrolase [Paenibacillus sp. NPDC058071]|uniref:glycosyl hydrolase n=1 Tax=Paenibacillus sp. NPDC058071 TaxID=3346326 RepID=UPI0036DF7BC2
MKTTRIEKHKAFLLAVAIAAISAVAGLINLWFDERNISNKEARLSNEPRLSPWLVDESWEEGVADLRKSANLLSDLQLFAAYFDEYDQLMTAPKLNEALPIITNILWEYGNKKLFLTLVNDCYAEDGTVVQKDSELVSRLMASPATRGKHIDEIVNVALSSQFDGIEIHYEGVKQDDWPHMTAFISELNRRLQMIGKLLRVVLEPQLPVERFTLPDGPSYVLVADDLQREKTEPGPKADYAFIDQLIKRMDGVPGERIIAFSAGGFDWTENGAITAVTEQHAADLAKAMGALPQRDDSSGSLYFTYRDSDGREHRVWYADRETLNGWIDRAKRSGIARAAIWRLGGLSDEMLAGLGVATE